MYQFKIQNFFFLPSLRLMRSFKSLLASDLQSCQLLQVRRIFIETILRKISTLLQVRLATSIPSAWERTTLTSNLTVSLSERPYHLACIPQTTRRELSYRNGSRKAAPSRKLISAPKYSRRGRLKKLGSEDTDKLHLEYSFNSSTY